MLLGLIKEKHGGPLPHQGGPARSLLFVGQDRGGMPHLTTQLPYHPHVIQEQRFEDDGLWKPLKC